MSETSGVPSAGVGDVVLLADVGNSRIKLALVSRPAASDGGRLVGLPTISGRRDIDTGSLRADHLRGWLRMVAPGPAVVLIASVHDAAAAILEMVLAEESATGRRPLRQRRIGHGDLPLPILLDEPHRVGIDRLAAATAASIVKPTGRGVIVVDCGTAATVDMISAEGEFLGGAILPGPALMARALAEGTSKLPEVRALADGDPPPMPGRNTREAIAAGIGWGMRGAIASLVDQARMSLGSEAPVILTGGWGKAVLPVLPDAIELPDLVLAGIALAADRACRR